MFVTSKLFLRVYEGLGLIDIDIGVGDAGTNGLNRRTLSTGPSQVESGGWYCFT